MTMGYPQGGGMAGGMFGQAFGWPSAQVGMPTGMMGAGYGYGQPFMGVPYGGMMPYMGAGYMGGGFGPSMAAPLPGMYTGMMMPPVAPTYGMGPWAGAMAGPTLRGALGAGPIGVPPSDEQICEMIYDSIDADPLVPFDSDIHVDVTGGVVTLTGTVPSKRIKHAVGDDAWWIPGVWDINNNLQVAPRRAAAGAEARQPAGAGARGR